MKTTPTFAGLRCPETDERFDATTSHHPDGKPLDSAYEYDAIELSRAEIERRQFGPGKYEELLPIPADARVSLGEGGTPLVDCPSLAEELGVGRVVIKDESANPTGTIADRASALAVSAARQHGANDVALSTPGDSGQSVAAYAARAGITSHVFVPSRASFLTKAMINVHGGDMNVVGGRLDDANEAFHASDEDWYSLQPFETPYRHEGMKPVVYELLEQLEWQVPDAVFCPFVGGGPIVGMAKAARELRELGVTDSLPAVYAAQSTACAPIVEAFESGADAHEPWDVPDTVCGALERPDPNGSALVLDALRETGGGAVASSDDTLLESAVTVASHEGIGVSVATGAAASAAWELRERFDEDDTVVLINTASAEKDADLLRSHLMGQGI
ncbi:threonine synthase [Halocatena pleomorpha]|uniref:Pyridoxal-phosphate dependent enzyme n=1 Tax=Halocatena pleomorpha TaxID=1785090 RepID=A0A3P3RDY2_9EURY|nr:threonine synthase [Halocatena pleomorpha]RRJ31676.1 pyridoxal-phosphate dependent enzyme [Halocatena pleomorpha]